MRNFEKFRKNTKVIKNVLVVRFSSINGRTEINKGVRVFEIDLENQKVLNNLVYILEIPKYTSVLKIEEKEVVKVNKEKETEKYNNWANFLKYIKNVETLSLRDIHRFLNLENYDIVLFKYHFSKEEEINDENFNYYSETKDILVFPNNNDDIGKMDIVVLYSKVKNVSENNMNQNKDFVKYYDIVKEIEKILNNW